MLQKLEDALSETQKTGDMGDTGETGLTGLSRPKVLRHDLTEINPKMGKTV